MNFQDLLAKMKQLDEAVVEPKDELQGGAGAGDECGTPSMGGADELLTSECGDMMPHTSAPKQSDSVTMNVSMNGSGAGGIADLMKILRNIEDAGDSHSDADNVLVGVGADEGFEDATTRPDPQTAGVDAVTPTGNDLASKGAEAEKVNGGGNPFNVDESLVRKLSAHYQSIKEGSDPQIDEVAPEYRDFSEKPQGPNQTGYKTNISGNPAIIAVQKKAVEIINKLDPSADTSKFAIDGSFGPRTKGLLDYAGTLLNRAPSTPENEYLKKEYWYLYSESDKAQGWRGLNVEKPGPAPVQNMSTGKAPVQNMSTGKAPETTAVAPNANKWADAKKLEESTDIIKLAKMLRN